MSIRHHSKYPILVFVVLILLVFIILIGVKPRIISSEVIRKAIPFNQDSNLNVDVK